MKYRRASFLSFCYFVVTVTDWYKLTAIVSFQKMISSNQHIISKTYDRAYTFDILGFLACHIFIWNNSIFLSNHGALSNVCTQKFF